MIQHRRGITDHKMDGQENTNPWHNHGNFILDIHEIDELVQDCRNSTALAMELLQSCTKPVR